MDLRSARQYCTVRKTKLSLQVSVRKGKRHVGVARPNEEGGRKTDSGRRGGSVTVVGFLEPDQVVPSERGSCGFFCQAHSRARSFDFST